MAGSVNKVILVGRAGKDPEVRHLQDGKPVVTLSLATSDSWRDKASGERRERTEWHRCYLHENRVKVAEACSSGSTSRRGLFHPQMDRQLWRREVQHGNCVAGLRGELTLLDSKKDGSTSMMPGAAPVRVQQLDDEVPPDVLSPRHFLRRQRPQRLPDGCQGSRRNSRGV